LVSVDSSLTGAKLSARYVPGWPYAVNCCDSPDRPQPDNSVVAKGSKAPACNILRLFTMA
jgi:hypothetical protein